MKKNREIAFISSLLVSLGLVLSPLASAASATEPKADVSNGSAEVTHPNPEALWLDPEASLPGVERTNDFGPLIEKLRMYRSQGVNVTIVQDANTGELISVEPRQATKSVVTPTAVVGNCNAGISACWYGYPLITLVPYGFWGVGNNTGTWPARGNFEMYAGVGQCCYLAPSSGAPTCSPLLLAGDGWAPGGAPIGVTGTDVVLI